MLYCRGSHKHIQLKGKGGGIPSKLLTSIGGSSSGAQSHLASLNSHTALIKTHLSSRHRFGFCAENRLHYPWSAFCGWTPTGSAVG